MKKKVNVHYISRLFDPLFSLSDEEISGLSKIDFNNELETKEFFAERILENFKLYGTGSREIVKNTLQYILCFLDKYKFDELFPYGDLPVEAPKNNELFFSWLWEELFPGEIMDSSDVSDFFVNNNYSEPNSAYIK